MAEPKQVGTKSPEPIEAKGQSAINDPRPGSTKEAKLYFEGLGDLADFPETSVPRTKEGVGTKVVILCDVLAGAEGEAYKKGEVQRISKLVNGYFEEDQDDTKAAIRRLMALGSIRHATPEEIERGFADVTMDSESEATKGERSKRLALEAEVETLRREVNKLKGTAGKEPAAPGTKDDPFGDESK